MGHASGAMTPGQVRRDRTWTDFGLDEARKPAATAPTLDRRASTAPCFEMRPSAAGGPPRRTVIIRGRGAERDLAFLAHRRAHRATTRVYERRRFRPERAAMWAVVLGLLLTFVAAATSHAAVRAGAGPRLVAYTIDRPR